MGSRHAVSCHRAEAIAHVMSRPLPAISPWREGS